MSDRSECATGSLFDSCPEAVISTDLAGCIMRWNPAAAELLAAPGVAVAELGSDAADLLRQADRAMYRVKLAQR